MHSTVKVYKGEPNPSLAFREDFPLYFCSGFLGFLRAWLLPRWLSGKESTNAGDTRDEDSVPGPERSLGGGKGNPSQYSCLENSMDTGAYSSWGHRELDMSE